MSKDCNNCLYCDNREGVKIRGAVVKRCQLGFGKALECVGDNRKYWISTGYILIEAEREAG